MNYRYFNNTLQASAINQSTFLTFIKDRLYYTCLQSTPAQSNDVHYFSIDNVLVYKNFYADFGPLNLAHVIRFCGILSRKLEDPFNLKKKLVFYSSFSSDKKANALFLICTYMMLVFKLSPEDAHKPMEGIADVILPFRDAGYGPDTYNLSILDCMKGLHKAIQLKLLSLEDFDLEEYEYYEKVDHGDFNWLVRGKFLAFATPHDDVPRVDPNAYPKTAQHPNYNILPHGVPWKMNDMINYFKKNKISTVVRLNHKVYDRERFLEQGIEHLELYFHDGSCPPDDILNAFLEIAESKERGAIAVHCKAGLGRTGSLIAAYLMKHYRFTASEVIGFLRVMRPGSVVGPQQNWLYSMQPKLWAMGDAEVKRKAVVAETRRNIQKSSDNVSNYTLSSKQMGVNNENQSPSGQLNKIETALPSTKTTLVGNEVLFIPVQPRKGSDAINGSVGPIMQAINNMVLDNMVDTTIPRSGSFSSHRYNLRSSTIAARSNPTSRSNSITFDENTTRSNSNASLKMKTILNNNSNSILTSSTRNAVKQQRKDAFFSWSIKT